MDNLPKDPPDENNPAPPPFGSSFDPHVNPVDPNNPYQTQTSSPNVPDPSYPPTPAQQGQAPLNHPSYSEVAAHKLRDSHGRFATDHLSSDSTSLKDPNDPNIFKKALDFLIKIKWQKVTLYITGLAALIYLIVSNPFFQNLVNHYFPNSSPILGRAISYQGVLKSSDSGIYSLVLPNQETYTLHFKPTTTLTNLKKLNEVVVKGNLTWTPYVIENAEIYPLNITMPEDQKSSSSGSDTSSLNSPKTLNIPNQDLLPKLYTGLTWETTQKKVLIFTSGRRKIEEDGVYLESAQVPNIPSDFINYYTNQLQNASFKETLNSTDPDGLTITYSKDDFFLTFGIKNVLDRQVASSASSGSGDNKKIVGYKAFIEHN